MSPAAPYKTGMTQIVYRRVGNTLEWFEGMTCRIPFRVSPSKAGPRAGQYLYNGELPKLERMLGHRLWRSPERYAYAPEWSSNLYYRVQRDGKNLIAVDLNAEWGIMPEEHWFEYYGNEVTQQADQPIALPGIQDPPPGGGGSLTTEELSSIRELISRLDEIKEVTSSLAVMHVHFQHMSELNTGMFDRVSAFMSEIMTLGGETRQLLTQAASPVQKPYALEQTLGVVNGMEGGRHTWVKGRTVPAPKRIKATDKVNGRRKVINHESAGLH